MPQKILDSHCRAKSGGTAFGMNRPLILTFKNWHHAAVGFSPQFIHVARGETCCAGTCDAQLLHHRMQKTRFMHAVLLHILQKKKNIFHILKRHVNFLVDQVGWRMYSPEKYKKMQKPMKNNEKPTAAWCQILKVKIRGRSEQI